jgi:hypothetical protein
MSSPTFCRMTCLSDAETTLPQGAVGKIGVSSTRRRTGPTSTGAKNPGQRPVPRRHSVPAVSLCSTCRASLFTSVCIVLVLSHI